MVEIERKWFGDQTMCRPDLNNFSSPEESLGFNSFLGLFLILAIAGALALVINATMFVYENLHVMEHFDTESSVWGKIVQLLHRFDSRDLESHTFKDIQSRNRDHVSCCDCHEFATNQQSPFSRASSGPSPSFSSPSGESITLERDQGSSTGNAIANQHMEASQRITQENQLAIPNKDNFSNQLWSHTVQ